MNAFAHPFGSVMAVFAARRHHAEAHAEAPHDATRPQATLTSVGAAEVLPEDHGGFHASGIVRSRCGGTYHEVLPSEELLRRLREAGL
ncbi:MAG: hypothetical protein KF891_11820 [Rhizobacter sp.]|nr:hypothetical protein [Rhizobacter sp.]